MTLQSRLASLCDAALIMQDDDMLLRPFHMSDADAVCCMAGDARVAATTTAIPHPYSLHDATSFIAAHQRQRSEHSALHWALCERLSMRLLGAMSLTLNVRDETATLGYWIGAEHWQKGWASRGARKVCAWSADVGFKKTAATCLASNIASQKVLSRCGFVQEGLLRQHVVRCGQRHDVLCFGLLHASDVVCEKRHASGDTQQTPDAKTGRHDP